MAFNLGAFAGGTARGIGSGVELSNLNRRSAMMEREVQLREQAGQRAEEEQGWQREAVEKKRAYDKDIEDSMKDIPWVKGQDGKIDVFTPENQPLYQVMLGNKIRTDVKHNKLNAQDAMAYASYQEKLSDKQSQDSITAFVASGMKDVAPLAPIFKKLGLDMNGSGIVRKQNPQTKLEEIYLQTGDGKTMPVPYLLAMSGASGSRVAAVIDKEADNARQSAIQSETVRHNKAVESRLSAAQGEKPTAEDRIVTKLDEKARRLKFATYVSDMSGKPLEDRSGSTLVSDIALSKTTPKTTEQEARRLVNEAFKIVSTAGDDIYSGMKADKEKFKEWSRLDPAARQADFEAKRERLVQMRLNPKPAVAAPAAAIAPSAATPTAAVPRAAIQTQGGEYQRGGGFRKPGVSW